MRLNDSQRSTLENALAVAKMEYEKVAAAMRNRRGEEAPAAMRLAAQFARQIDDVDALGELLANADAIIVENA